MPNEFVTLMLVETPEGDHYLAEAPQLQNIAPGLLVTIGDLVGTIALCVPACRGNALYKMLCAFGGTPKKATGIYKPMPMAE